MDFSEINQQLGERIEDLLAALQVDLYEYGDDYVGACPIHGGQGLSAFRLHGPHHEFPLRYTCWSRSCNEHFNRSLVGFVRGVLSHQLYLWNGPGDEECPWSVFFDWVYNFLGDTVPKNKIIKKEHSNEELSPLWTEFEYRKQFSIPSRYYIGRGFSDEVLSRYLVADSNQYGTLFKRAIIPLLKDRKVMGISSRSILKQCNECNLFHQGCCPEPDKKGYPSYQRWVHKLKKSQNLYNYHQSLDWLCEHKTCIMVESPNSVLKMEDAGIPGSLATFGCKVSRGQFELLAKAGVETIILMFDGDDSGTSGARSIANKYGMDFNIKIPSIDMENGKDLADYPTETVRRTMNKKLERLSYPL